MAARTRRQLRQSAGCRCGGVRKRHKDFHTRIAFERLSKKYDELAQLVAASAADAPLPSTARAFKAERGAPRTIANAIARIVGGFPVAPGEFPECTLVGRRAFNGTVSWFCTGVLVHPRIVLTAAHCLDPARPANIVALRAEDVDHLENAELRVVRRMVRHPQYLNTGFHDISVMILRRDATVPPVRLALAGELAQSQNTTLVGFGNDDVLSTKGFGIKREVTVPITDPSPGGGSPEDAELELGFDADLEFVAGGAGFDSCNGDSGGPAYIDVTGERAVAGLTSRGTETARNPCGDGGIYTRVDVHLAFIRRVAANHNITF
jgi:secreted trypsin-like serine protease